MQEADDLDLDQFHRSCQIKEKQMWCKRSWCGAFGTIIIVAKVSNKRTFFDLRNIAVIAKSESGIATSYNARVYLTTNPYF